MVILVKTLQIYHICFYSFQNKKGTRLPTKVIIYVYIYIYIYINIIIFFDMLFTN